MHKLLSLLAIVAFIIHCNCLSWTNNSHHLAYALKQQCIGISSSETIFLFGGRNTGYSDGNYIHKWEYPYNNEWIEINAMSPTPVFTAAGQNTVSIGDLVYFVGAYNSDGTHTATEINGKMFIFNMNTEQWLIDINENDTTMAIPANRGCAVTNKQYIYYIGGETTPYAKTVSNKIQIFNVSARKWLNISLYPTISKGTAYQSCALINNIIYWFGGGYSQNIDTSKEIFKYNITSNIVSNKAIAFMTENKYGTQAVVGPDENVYITGGSTQNSAIQSTVEIFDVYKERIINTSNMLVPVYEHACAVLNFSIFVFGGYNYISQSGYLSLIQQSNQIAPIISFKFINNSNYDIYGGALLLFEIKYSEHVHFMTTYRLWLECDELNIYKKIIVRNSKNYQCVMSDVHNYSYAYEWINCSDGIIIPQTIKILSIKENMYKMKVNYDYLNFKRQTTMNLYRKVANLTILIPKEVTFGEKVVVNYLVNNKINNWTLIQPQSYISLLSSSLGLKVDVKINHINNTCQICDVSGCYLCSNGISVVMPSDLINQQFKITLNSSDTYLSYYSLYLKIISCPIGSSNVGSKCIKCSYNFYNIKSGGNCTKCNANDNAYSCLGSDNIIISYNHWINLNDLHHKTTITSSKCPQNYCCTRPNGCKYNNTLNLCEKNRNYNVTLCGACIDGYSEVYGSTACKKCNNNYSILLIPIFLALLYSLILAYSGCKNKAKNKHPDNTNNITMKDLKIMLFRVIIYYCQSVYVILSQPGSNGLSELNFYLLPMLKLFMLQMLVSNDKGSAGICFISNLTFFGKESFYLFLPMMIFIWLIIGKLFQSSSIVNKCNKLSIINFNINQACWSCVLIGFGMFSSTMFRFLSCIKVGNVTVHFYAGYKQCYHEIWILSLFGILLSIFGFILILYKIYKINNIQNRYEWFIVQPYKSNQWFWEFILISRRMILSFGMVFGYLSFAWSNLLITIILILYLLSHWNCYPFLNINTNRLETLCNLISITTLLSVQFLSDQYFTILSFLLIFIILIPIILYVFYLIQFVKTRYSNKINHMNEYNEVLLTTTTT